MAVNTIQTVGDFAATFYHPLVDAGAQITLKGFKLDDVFLTSAQDMDNAKRIPLVNGDTVALTNTIKAGKITINALRVSDKVTDGDLPLIATTLQGVADNIGGVLSISYGFNGATEAITFYGVVLVSCPPLILAGNDLPPYPVIFSYGTYTRG